MAVLLDKFITATADMEAEERGKEVEEMKRKEPVCPSPQSNCALLMRARKDTHSANKWPQGQTTTHMPDVSMYLAISVVHVTETILPCRFQSNTLDPLLQALTRDYIDEEDLSNRLKTLFRVCCFPLLT